MLKLAKVGAARETDTTLGADGYTQHFVGSGAKTGVILYSLFGDFSGHTVTLQVSYDKGTTFIDYVAKDPTGTPAEVAYTAACNDCIYGPGQTFRFHCETGGGTPDVDIQISGDVHLA